MVSAIYIILTKYMDIYIDEAGRWPLAGPVYVGLVHMIVKWWYQDSKVISSQKRDRLYNELQKQTGWSYGRASAKYIDTYGIVAAIRHAIYQWLRRLLSEQWSYTIKKLSHIAEEKDVHLHIDGNTDFGITKHLHLPCTTYICGDSRIWQISAASIIAKVCRDQYMIRQSQKYPQYYFDQHKWYGTEKHRDILRRMWFSNLHRKSFCTRIIAN